MAVSYKKLWKLLIDRDMKKKDLCAAAGISHASVAKLGKNENALPQPHAGPHRPHARSVPGLRHRGPGARWPCEAGSGL